MTSDPPEVEDNIDQDPKIITFVVRVWREDADGNGIWRGHITPIPDGNRFYFTNVNDIPAFLQDYLKSME